MMPFVNDLKYFSLKPDDTVPSSSQPGDYSGFQVCDSFDAISAKIRELNGHHTPYEAIAAWYTSVLLPAGTRTRTHCVFLGIRSHPVFSCVLLA